MGKKIKKKNKRMLKNLCIGAGLFLGMNILSSNVFATEATDANGFYKDDVIAPWGRMQIIGAKQVNGVYQVNTKRVSIQIFAADDKCADDEIKYFLSTSPISTTEKVSEWKDYEEGETVEVILPNSNAINSLYLVLKDKNGNTSIVYDSSLSQTVTYDLNADDAFVSSTMTTERVYGSPFVITNQTPIRKGYYFLGWAVNQDDTIPSYRQGDIVPADAQIGAGEDATLYAVWSTEVTKLPKLADVAKVGDYVNYPVWYENVNSFPSQGSYIAKRSGWRVLSKDVDIDGKELKGTVNLISAGVPMTYYLGNSSKPSVENLAINFLDIPFGTSSFEYIQSGFNSLQTLSEIFDNKFTQKYTEDTSVSYSGYSGTKAVGTLKVRSMTKSDLDKIFDPTGNTETVKNININKAEHEELIVIPSNISNEYAVYYLASVQSRESLWVVYKDGLLGSGRLAEGGIRPVVSLKPEIVAEGTDMLGSWKIHLIEN